jgi:enoyl-CoA hydratase
MTEIINSLRMVVGGGRFVGLVTEGSPTGFVKYRREGRVGIVTLDRPERRNSIGPDMAQDLEAAWDAFVEDDEAWVGVLLGAGPSFCAGRDIKGDMAPLPRTKLSEYFVPETDRPLVVGVQGHVIGLGWYMAAGCDLCVAADDARFAMTQLRVGLPGPYNFAPRLNLTPHVAFELVALGRPLDARRAHQLGIVNEVVAPDEVAARAMAVAGELLALPPGQLRLTKALLRATDGAVPEGVKRLYWEGRSRLEDHPDTTEARVALRERREPRYTG